jgi:nucleoside-diphosphate-sugar epimerase
MEIVGLKKPLRILITGHAGYIGPHAVELFQRQGHHVTGCDLFLYNESRIDLPAAPDEEWKQDFRSLSVTDLKGFDAIIHLAAISNDPMGNLTPQLTIEVNRHGSIELAGKAKQAGIGRFLFSGSCSIYGKGAEEFCSEESSLNPLTAYAKSKIETENELRKMAGSGFSPVFLRNATAYGYSPFFRVDLVANSLLTSAMATGEIRIQSDGEPWRPLIHCRDIAAAFLAIAESDPHLTHNCAINIGSTNENYQVKTVAALVKELVPESVIRFTGETGNDPRNYKVDFSLFARLFPDFKWEYTLRSGLENLLEKLQLSGLPKEELLSERFIRLRLLQKKLTSLSN